MDLEAHIFFLCTQVVYRRERALSVTLKPLGLLPTEWRTLGALMQRGPLTMQELAQWTAYERTRLTRILHGMEARSLVVRVDSATDGRSVVVCLAPAGEDLYRKASTPVERLTEKILKVCSQSEIDSVRVSLQTIRKKLLEMAY